MKMMKSIKRVLVLTFVVVMCACFAAFAAACGEKPEPEPTPEPPTEPPTVSITLDKTEVSIELHESYTLTATTENVTSALTWLSSDESVATVDAGKIKALKEGNTTVTVKADGAEATCAVTVFDGGTAPVLKIGADSVGVNKGAKYTFDVASLWKGNVIEDENIEYTWRLSDGAPEGIAAVTMRADGKAEVEGLEYGDTEWTVSASVYGHNLAGSVAIKVVDLSVNYRAGENIENTEDGFKVDLSLSEMKGLFTTAINVDVYEDDEKSDVALEWTQTSGEDYVGYADGKLTAIAEGSATFTSIYKNNPVKLTVNAYRPEITVEKHSILERVGGNGTGAIKLDFTGLTFEDKPIVIEGTVKKATVNGTDVFSAFDSGSNTLTYNRAGLTADKSEMGKALAMTLETDKVIYVMTAEVVTKAFATAAEYNEIGTIARQVTGTNNYDGYFILTDDLDFENDRTKYTSEISNTDGGTFYGVIDGRGHVIKNLTITTKGTYGWSMAFIGKLGDDATIKNIAFVNARMGTTEESGGDTFFCSSDSGVYTVENVYIELTFGKVTWGAQAFGSSVRGLKIKNVIVKIGNADAYARHFAYQICVADGYVDGAYFVCDSTKSIALAQYYKDANTAAASLEDCKGSYGVYASDDAMKAENNDYTAFRNSDFWQITSDGLPYPAGLKYVRNAVSHRVNEVETLGNGENYIIDISDVDVFGTLESVTVGGEAKNSFSYADGKITLSRSETSATVFGEKAVVATFKHGDDVITVTNKTLFITKKIATAADFNKIATWAKQASGTNDYNGYFVLTDDLDFESDNSKYDSEISTTTNVFYGTIDGRGHSIKNLSIATEKLDQNFIKVLGTGAVVKNLAFVNAFCGTDGHGGDTFFASWKSGVYSVENVYIDLKFASIDWGVNAFGAPIGGFKAKNVVVKIADNVPKAYFSAQLCTADGYIDGVYFVTGAATKALSQGYKAPGGANASAPNDNWTYGVYASDEEMKESNNDYAAFTASGYWTLVDGLPVFGVPAQA